ncbi:MAG: sensor domain-containing diguanylate cyclase [Rhodospirillales bacterium]|jgi:diguanylate cyclase (GGDEF)-like protein/PAS domain S-box-containing protein|nr:sensor domain-containing diguanylate cyclase [Rhodospirillales bacterium]MDP6774596.1 sensor domain-containing diguanylate cyclase [Rhodospirillales bacterium]
MSKDKSAKPRKANEDAGAAAAETLVTGCPGPAVLVRPDGGVIAANARGAAVRALLQRGDSPEIAALIATAVAGQSVANGTLSLPGAGGGAVQEITVVPVLSGSSLLVLARDLTLGHYVRDALVESRQRYKDLVEASSDFAWEVGADGTFVFVSPRGALGYSTADLVGRRPAELILDTASDAPVPFTTESPLEEVEIWMRHADGTQACVILACIPLFDDNGRWRGARGVCRDATEARALEDALARARYREQLLGHVVSTFRDEVEPRNMLSAAAAATARALKAEGCRIYRRAPSETFDVAAEYGDADGFKVSKSFLTRLAGAPGTIDHETARKRLLAAATRYQDTVNGAVMLWNAEEGGDWKDDDYILLGDVASHLGVANAQIDKHEKIVRLSRTDPLTELLNRRALLEDELPRRLKRLKRGGRHSALFYVDLDNFKQVNDAHGHQRGDEALLAVRDMLIKHSRPGDVIARHGGDEFAMWIEGITEKVAVKRARTLIAAGRELAHFSGSQKHPLGLSVGVALYNPEDGESLDDLVARADAAMYTVKRSGKSDFEMAPHPTKAAEGRAAGRDR